MSEKLNFAQSESNVECKEFADRFRVDPGDYPIFRQQVQLDERWGNNEGHRWNIDKTASEYVTDTANLIAVMDGTAEIYADDPGREKPDHVIYLDKSARPVSWLVNTFWKDFSEEERPSHSYLNIDRLPWFRRAGFEVTSGGYIRGRDGSQHKVELRDFLEEADKIPQETFARIRALFIPGGVETEDFEEIMRTPTSLDGKNLLIIDEVQETGSTLGIAKYLLSRAIPELKSVNGDYFWDSGIKKNGDGTETQQLSVPVWYSHTTSAGRGIGDVNEPFFQERYEENPTPRTRARALGALALSQPVNLAEEPGELSRELAREIQQLHRDYQDGKVFLQWPRKWDEDKAMDLVEAQGVRFAPETDKSPDTYINVIKAINARPAY